MVHFHNIDLVFRTLEHLAKHRDDFERRVADKGEHLSGFCFADPIKTQTRVFEEYISDMETQRRTLINLVLKDELYAFYLSGLASVRSFWRGDPVYDVTYVCQPIPLTHLTGSEDTLFKRFIVKCIQDAHKTMPMAITMIASMETNSYELYDRNFWGPAPEDIAEARVLSRIIKM